MKTQKTSLIIFITVSLMLLRNNANAQLKLYTSGSLSIGSITQPPVNSELQVIGNAVFSANTGIIISSAYVKGVNMFSSAANPDYTWYGDTTTGIFHAKYNSIGFAVAGKQAMLFSSSSNVIIDSTIDNGDRLQVNASLNQNPLDIYSNNTRNSLYSGVNWLNNTTTKAWAVKNGANDEFFVYGNGQAYSYGWNTISDSTLKENVLAINNALEKTLRLQGVTYNLKAQNNELSSVNTSISGVSVRQMGLIAQSVERVIPEVVTTNSNGIKTIAYSNLVGLLVEAIKEEDDRVNKLQNKLDSCIAVTKHPDIIGINRNSDEVNKDAILYPCSACPANSNVTFHCYVPVQSKNASLLVFDMSGTLKKTIPIYGKEKQLVNINGGELLAGMYYYSLMVDGNEVDTKKVIMTQN